MEQFLTAFILTLLFIRNSAKCPNPKYIAPYYLYTTSCCQDDLDVFRPSPDGKFPEMPKILEITDFLRKDKIGIKAVWNANLTHLKGFKIEYVYKDTGVKICRILDYSEFLKNKSIDNHNFEFEIHPVRKNKEILVHLYPLPESGNNYPPAQEVDTLTCREWITKIDHKIKEDKLIVDFEQGPSKCNIKMYNINLYDGQSQILMEATVNSSKTTTKLTHEFHGICSGTYFITVEIVDEHPFTNCICVNRKQQCGGGCYRSRSNEFTIYGSSSTVPSSINMTSATMEFTTTETKSTFKLTIFLAFVGVMISLLLLVLSFYCYKRSFREKRLELLYTKDQYRNL